MVILTQPVYNSESIDMSQDLICWDEVSLLIKFRNPKLEYDWMFVKCLLDSIKLTYFNECKSIHSILIQICAFWDHIF